MSARFAGYCRFDKWKKGLMRRIFTALKSSVWLSIMYLLPTALVAGNERGSLKGQMKGFRGAIELIRKHMKKRCDIYHNEALSA